mgnify:CR=1 FL=1
MKCSECRWWTRYEAVRGQLPSWGLCRWMPAGIEKHEDAEQCGQGCSPRDEPVRTEPPEDGQERSRRKA